jgi:hypothetical protein
LKAILDTCILKLATFPNLDNPAALIVSMCAQGLLECWASPAMLEEYSIVLADEPEVLALVQSRMEAREGDTSGRAGGIGIIAGLVGNINLSLGQQH